MKQTKHFTLQEDIQLIQTNFLIMILFHQKLVIGPKETRMRTQPTKLIGNCKCLCPSRRKAAENNISANSLTNKSPPEVTEEVPERISPSNIFLLRKAKTAVKRGRSARWWEIMTRSPLKKSLLNVIKKKMAKENLWWFYCWQTIVFRKEEDAQGEIFLSWLRWVITTKNRRRHIALGAKDPDTSGVLP